LNSLTLVGNVGGEPKDFTIKGKEAFKFSVAENNSDKSTTWYSVVSYQKSLKPLMSKVYDGKADNTIWADMVALPPPPKSGSDKGPPEADEDIPF
jgi:Single-strand binding protein family